MLTLLQLQQREGQQEERRLWIGDSSSIEGVKHMQQPAAAMNMVEEEGRRRLPQQQRRRRRGPGAAMPMVATATTLLALAGAAHAFVVVPRGAPGLSSLGLQQQQQPQQWRPASAASAGVASSIRPAGGRRGLATLFMASKLKEGSSSGSKQASGFDPLGAASGSGTKAGLAAVAEPKEGGVVVDGEEKSNLIYKGMLLVVAILWGSNFGALKYLDTCGVDVSLLTSMRFLLASVALLPSLWGKGFGVLKAGLEVGLWVTLGYITQAIGLETTDVRIFILFFKYIFYWGSCLVEMLPSYIMRPPPPPP